MSAILETLVAEYGGRIALAKVNADTNPRLAQAFQLQAIPAFFLVIQGQVQPLFQGLAAEPQVRQLFDQILKIAQEAGLADATSEDSQPTESPVDPRYQRAFEAIDNGDWDAATAAYNEALEINPGDADAKAGLLQVAFLRRATVLDLEKVLTEPMAGVEDRLKRADALMLTGNIQQAFTLLLDGVRSDLDNRDAYKDRLVEFFNIMGDIPEVHDARRALTNALF
jgi:putative thioredoxin